MRILRDELLPQLDADNVSSVFFYGSGVRPELESVMEQTLRKVFPQVGMVEAHSDLLALHVHSAVITKGYPVF